MLTRTQSALGTPERGHGELSQFYLSQATLMLHIGMSMISLTVHVLQSTLASLKLATEHSEVCINVPLGSILTMVNTPDGL